MRLLVFSAHTADFCSRAGGTIALHAIAGAAVKVVTLTYGERSESGGLYAGGPRPELDAVKAVMTGAHAVQMVSALLRHGPARLREVREKLAEWLERHEYESLEQMRGSLDLARVPDPAAYERANYVRLLQTWRP